SLGRACQLYQNVYRKSETGDEGHGVITPQYVRYNRADVLATAELTIRGFAQYARFGLSAPPTRLYSPASLTKGMLRDTVVVPRLRTQPEFWHGWHGATMEGFFGGRTECRIRGCVVPVRPLDFFSMYPTIWELMGLSELMVAES